METRQANLSQNHVYGSNCNDGMCFFHVSPVLKSLCGMAGVQRELHLIFSLGWRKVPGPPVKFHGSGDTNGKARS